MLYAEEEACCFGKIFPCLRFLTQGLIEILLLEWILSHCLHTHCVPEKWGLPQVAYQMDLIRNLVLPVEDTPALGSPGMTSCPPKMDHLCHPAGGVGRQEGARGCWSWPSTSVFCDPGTLRIALWFTLLFTEGRMVTVDDDGLGNIF